ncbi:hypothetical protein CPHO_00815 [Corynebacterium phocae]|uniref:CsbD-like domain-containing protein n=1 Tax=Corynebacterium phocae TaxID=161895 RepID=A0A1L7D6F9_9CORY|nr:CsbD family protein [Corynebacterium phocae]APT93573.1 hypothetical protein CPHO_00815 [Corynebacterium phocae]KAA8728613.1 CsbD family protein [Corynebacterium phocae]
MSEIKNKGEELLGSAKETAGDVTGNKSLENEGKADQATAKIKDAANDVKEKAEEVVGNVMDAVNDKLNKN